jgi:autotransporter passenger strand-loop-strand repeat protein
VASATTVLSGGTLYYAGGTAAGLKVSAGATEVVG